eukprot:3408194-Amphidinium_carterae.1
MHAEARSNDAGIVVELSRHVHSALSSQREVSRRVGHGSSSSMTSARVVASTGKGYRKAGVAGSMQWIGKVGQDE